MSEIDKRVIDNVRRLRLDKGLTASDLAYWLDVNQSFIQNIESNRTVHKYNLNHITKISFLLDCNISELIPKMEDVSTDEELRLMQKNKESIFTNIRRKLLKRR